jgi:hypothetical protein
MSTVILDAPIEYQRHRQLVEVKHEEDALCWLWAFPHLMPWPRKIVWLYTPVDRKWGRWFKYNFALQKKRSQLLLANADNGSNRN